MTSFAAFIGHQPHISLAELSAAVPGFTLEELIGRAVVLFGGEGPLDQAFLDTLGGTVVLAEKLETASPTLEDLPSTLLAALGKTKGKMTFSLRTNGLAPSQVRDLYRDCKAFLKKNGIPSRYVGGDREPAPSVLLRDTGILDGSGGCEIVVIQLEKSLWIGKTVGAQDVDAYTERDMEKPVRDTTVGLLPPKLAQVLLNFGVWLTKSDKRLAISDQNEKKKGSSLIAHRSSLVIFDPFCGTGVIPLEALLRGFPVLASDKSEKAVTGCQKNIDWLRKKKKILKTDVPSAVWKQDALRPFDLSQEKSIKERPAVIVTETSLGPALKSRPSAKDAQSLKSDNEKLQEGFLKSAAQSLPGVPLVCTWPVWYYSKGPIRLERIWKAIDALGYRAVLPPHVQPSGDRPTLLYRRPDQFVGREIVLLQPKK